MAGMTLALHSYAMEIKVAYCTSIYRVMTDSRKVYFVKKRLPRLAGKVAGHPLVPGVLCVRLLTVKGQVLHHGDVLDGEQYSLLA